MHVNAIETDKITKVYRGGAAAVYEVDLTISPGTVYGLVGRNGAGKTTLIRMLMGLLHPTRGAARILGEDFRTAPRQRRAQVAYVPQATPSGVNMNMVELSYFNSHFYERWDATYAETLCQRFDVPPLKPIGALSGGQQRMAFIIAALAAQPEVLLLDEPAAGLDPVSRREWLEQLVVTLADRPSCAILISTHILADLERLADRIGVLERGRLRFSSSVDDLKADHKRVQIIFPGNAPPLDFSLPHALQYEADGPVVKAVVHRADFAAVERCQQIPGVRIQEFPIGLEDLVIDLMTNDRDE